jgi:hypothetical protein
VMPLSLAGEDAADQAEMVAVMTLSSVEGYVQVKYDGSKFVVEQYVQSAGVTTTLGESALAAASGSGEAGAGWHYVMLTEPGENDVDPSSYMLYVDGTAVALTTPDVSLQRSRTSGTCDLVLGGPYLVGASSMGRAFKGYMDEVTVWQKSLTACQSYQLMWGNLTSLDLHPRGADTAQLRWDNRLLAYLKMNDKFLINNIATDSSGKGAQGTLGGLASFMDATVPFLAPSFNRPRPRLVPPTSLKADPPGPNGMRMQSNSYPMQENITYPRGNVHFYDDYLILPGDEVLLDRSTVMIPVEGRKSLKVVGFGFAESAWLRCEVNGIPMAAKWINIDEVECDVTPLDAPGYYNLSVTNFYPSQPGCDAIGEGAQVAIRSTQRGQAAQALSATVPTVLEVSEMALSLTAKAANEPKQFAFNEDLSALLVEDGTTFKGTTFGAWFYPTELGTTDQTVMCFATTCEAPSSPPPPPPSPPPAPVECDDANMDGNCPDSGVAAPPPNAPSPPSPSSDLAAGTPQACITYKNQMVMLTHEGTSSYGALKSINSTNPLTLPAVMNKWHYVEVTIAPDGDWETVAVPTYVATLTVDRVTVTGNSPATDVRVPLNVPELASGVFMVGGLGCPTSTTNQRTFVGMIDEVRVFEGVHKSNWFERLPGWSAETERWATEHLVAYYRMSSRTQTSRYLNVMAPTGSIIEDSGPNLFHLTYRTFGNTAATPVPTYTPVAVPFEPATALSASVEKMELDRLNTTVITIDG